MVSIVFTCIWLEATLHLLIVGRYGKERFEELDRNSYERKLEALRCGDEDLLRWAGRLRKILAGTGSRESASGVQRRRRVHERADDGPRGGRRTLGRSWRPSSTGSVWTADGSFQSLDLVPLRRATVSTVSIRAPWARGLRFSQPEWTKIGGTLGRTFTPCPVERPVGHKGPVAGDPNRDCDANGRRTPPKCASLAIIRPLLTFSNTSPPRTLLAHRQGPGASSTLLRMSAPILPAIRDADALIESR